MSPITPLDIRRAAMDLLAFREHSIQELVTKLTRRFQKRQSQKAPSHSDRSFNSQRMDSSCSLHEGFGDILLEQISLLTNENLQSDQRFAESFVRSRINKGQGPMRIKNELSSRGVADYIITVALEEADADWSRVIAELSSRKYGDSTAKDEKEKAKRMRFFQYRGFSYEHIKTLSDQS